jgi:hypothetical protein
VLEEVADWSVEDRQMRYGTNEMRIPVKSVAKLIFDEMWHPFYVFQVGRAGRGEAAALAKARRRSSDEEQSIGREERTHRPRGKRRPSIDPRRPSANLRPPPGPGPGGAPPPSPTQYFSIVVWVAGDAYWTYAVCIFAITWFSIITSAVEAHSNMRRLADIAYFATEVGGDGCASLPWACLYN